VQPHVISWNDWFHGTPSAEHGAEVAKAAGLGQQIPVSGDVYGVLDPDTLSPWQPVTPYSCVLTPDFELVDCLQGGEFEPVLDLIEAHAAG